MLPTRATASPVRYPKDVGIIFDAADPRDGFARPLSLIILIFTQ